MPGANLINYSVAIPCNNFFSSFWFSEAWERINDALP